MCVRVCVCVCVCVCVRVRVCATNLREEEVLIALIIRKESNDGLLHFLHNREQTKHL